MSEDKEIKRIKRNIKTDENDNKYYSPCNSYDIVIPIEYLLSKIEKLEKVVEAANSVAWINAIGPVKDGKDFRISTYFIHEVWINELRKALKELEDS